MSSLLFAILQMYEFSSKSQQPHPFGLTSTRCLRYCKCTSFQANHNPFPTMVVSLLLFAILQMYEFSSKSQLLYFDDRYTSGCLRYCKCTSFQANHNSNVGSIMAQGVVCDTANVRVFKQITTSMVNIGVCSWLFAILQMYEFSSKSQRTESESRRSGSCLRYCKCTSFQANHNHKRAYIRALQLFAILQMYEFSSKSQHLLYSLTHWPVVCDTSNVRGFKQITTGV